MIIARETLKSLYSAGNQLSTLPVEPGAVGHLGELLTEALNLSAQVSIAELAEGFAELQASDGRVAQARRLTEAAEVAVGETWSGQAKIAAAAAMQTALARLARIRAATDAAKTVQDQLSANIADVEGVIEDGRQRLSEARDLMPMLVAASRFYQSGQFEPAFERVRTGGATGAALVYQAYLRFDVLCGDAREALVAIGQSVAVQPAPTPAPQVSPSSSG